MTPRDDHRDNMPTDADRAARIQSLLEDADLANDAALEDLLLTLASVADAPPPTPSADLTSLLGPAKGSNVRPLRGGRGRRGIIAGSIGVVGFLGISTSAAALTGHVPDLPQALRDLPVIAVVVEALGRTLPEPAQGPTSSSPPVATPGSGRGPAVTPSAGVGKDGAPGVPAGPREGAKASNPARGPANGSAGDTTKDAAGSGDSTAKGGPRGGRAQPTTGPSTAPH